MNLSEHFNSDELLRSDAATRLNITEQFMPAIDIVDSMKALCENCLEPLRTALNRPVLITSGYRCERTNKAIGGAIDSQHTLGQAADIHVEGMTTEQLYLFIKGSKIPYDQLIQEFNKWVHISFGTPRRHSCLRAEKRNGETVYFPDNA